MTTFQVVNRLDGRGFDVVDPRGETYNEEPIKEYAEALWICRDLNAQEDESAYWSALYRSSPWI